ncbi:MAG: hypothetical protein M3R13_06515 [Armatimonadota bacterium]|nr:hypothetical protein [Armatimonadota bacterium]
MAFPKWQNPLDWLTQCCHIGLGRKVSPGMDEWLVGPVGLAGETASEFIERLAAEKRLTISRNAPGSGLLSQFENWGFPIDPNVADFYNHTIDYTFEVRSTWKPRFGVLGKLVSKLFSRRIQQFNLPNVGRDETASFKSDLIQLIDVGGKVVYTVWIRSMKETGDIVFYGIYSTCQLPSGGYGVKSVFPLPQGNATVIFAVREGPRGQLQLVSSGKEHCDTGFYFFVEDRRGILWKRYIPGFRQQISVYNCETSELGAEHSMAFWMFKAYHMNYRIRKINSHVEANEVSR